MQATILSLRTLLDGARPRPIVAGVGRLGVGGVHGHFLRLDSGLLDRMAT